MMLETDHSKLLPGSTPFLPKSRWKVGAFLFAIAAFVTFLINLSFITWATAKRSPEDGIGMILDEDCPTVKKWNTALHIVINIISTILLAGSNFCMQCLIAPTRLEVDRAHSKTKWLDIGIPSIRNFWTIAYKRKILWLLLAISSFPLHIIFNSIVFISISTNEYGVYAVNDYFLREKDVNMLPDVLRTDDLVTIHAAIQAGDFESLTLEECLNAYGNTFQSSQGNLLLVVPGNGTENQFGLRFIQTVSFGIGDESEYFWICWNEPSYRTGSGLCEDLLPDIKRNPENWSPIGTPLQECHSQRTEDHCKLLFSSPLCWIVTALNLLKSILMLLVAFGNDKKPLLTIGDAVSSFLEEEDTFTENMCLASKNRIKTNTWEKVALIYKPVSHRKFKAASGIRWITCISLYLLAIILCIVLLVYGLTKTGIPASKIMRYGLGEISTKLVIVTSTLMYWGHNTVLLNVVLANTPQVIMSLLYFNYNALFTCISLITKWDKLSCERKGLRVSSTPQGSQRETYFLQLPYRYSLPLAVFSGVLHWLISQGIFLVNVEFYGPNKDNPAKYEPSGYNLRSCGWSPVGVICIVIVAGVMLGVLLIFGWRRLRYGIMPVAGSCSAAISAACHPGRYERDIWKKPLSWGVISEPEAEPRHCSFSSEPVEKPVEGFLYA